MRVLVAEDDAHILRGITEVLEADGYEVYRATNGKEAVALFIEHAPDFVFLDIMMPLLNGYDVCRELRRRDAKTPIVFLSAKSEEIDKVLGLELGADDYILKPFGVKELVARVRAISRRCLAVRSSESATPRREDEPFVLKYLRVIPIELRARRGEETIELSLREVRILRALFDHAGQVLDRDTLFKLCWDIEHYPNSRTLDQHISKLRKKIELDPKVPAIIRTVHGAGYRFER